MYVGLEALHVICQKRSLRLCLTGHAHPKKDKLTLATLEIKTRDRELVARVPITGMEALDEAADELMVALNKAQPFAGGPP